MKARFLIVLALLPAMRAEACTMCYSDTALQVRTILFNDAFLQNFAVAGLPFVVVGALAAVIYRVGFG